MARTESILTPSEILRVEELGTVANNTVIYKNNSGVISAVPLGANGSLLSSQGNTSAPVFTAAGSFARTDILNTYTKNGDQNIISTDASHLRNGQWTGVFSGDLYTLVGQEVMEYTSHNFAIDTATGNFLGRDEASVCQLWVLLENGEKRRYDAVTNTAGVVPTFTLTSTETATGYTGTLLTAAQPNVTSIGAQASDLNMNTHKITNITNGAAANDAINYGQAQAMIVALDPVSPVAVPEMLRDNLSAQPGTTVVGQSYLVGATATGAVWTGKEGYIMEALDTTGTTWTDVLGRAVIVGDRLGITFEAGTGALGGFAGKDKNIATITTATPGSYAYSFLAPTTSLITTIQGANARDKGHQYNYNTTSTLWVDLGASSIPTAGTALSYSGNTLNVLKDATSITTNGSNQLTLLAVDQTIAGATINGATNKVTPVDADYIGLMDSAASNVLKKLSWSNIKVTLKAYLDTLYLSLGGGTLTGTLAMGSNSITITGSIGATAARVTKGWFTDIESTNMPTVGGTSLATTFAGGNATQNIGYLNIPQNSQSAAYTTVIGDAGKHIYHPSADTTARTFTIDSNANVAYPIGTAITFVNDTSGGVITIAITTDTLILAGAGTTGSRTLATNGIATAIKMTSTRWMISGTGLT